MYSYVFIDGVWRTVFKMNVLCYAMVSLLCCRLLLMKCCECTVNLRAISRDIKSILDPKQSSTKMHSSY